MSEKQLKIKRVYGCVGHRCNQACKVEMEANKGEDFFCSPSRCLVQGIWDAFTNWTEMGTKWVCMHCKAEFDEQQDYGCCPVCVETGLNIHLIPVYYER